MTTRPTITERGGTAIVGGHQGRNLATMYRMGRVGRVARSLRSVLGQVAASRGRDKRSTRSIIIVRLFTTIGSTLGQGVIDGWSKLRSRTLGVQATVIGLIDNDELTPNMI